MAIGVQVWSQTPASNATADSNINWAEGMAPSQVNDSARSLMGSVAKWRDDNNGTIVTSGTTLAFTAVTNQIEGSLVAGYTVKVLFNATSDSSATLNVDGLGAKPMQLVSGTNAGLGAFAAGSIWCFTYSTTGTGQWIAHGGFPVLTNATAALSGDVSLTTTSTFDGPTVSVGTTGVWFASGTVTLQAPGTGNTEFTAKLWDGTTVMDSGMQSCVTSAHASISLSGLITNPVANLKITATSNRANATLTFNASGNSKDCSISALRVG